MPSPKDNTKMTGDTHLAEIESDKPIEEGSPIGLGTRGMQSGLVGHAVKKAGVITDGKDHPGDDDQVEDRRTTSGKPEA